MKKLLPLLLILLMIPSALAESLPLVIDGAGLLTGEQISELEGEARRLSAEHGMDIVILTVESIGRKGAELYAADYFDDNGYGQGPRHDGALLMLSMEERDWAIATTGRGISAFTDYGQEALSGDFLPYFSRGDYYGGFSRFLRGAEVLLKQYAAGPAYDAGMLLQLRTPGERVLSKLGAYALASAVLAALGLFILSRGMKTARIAGHADRYARGGRMALERSGDYYLYRTHSRVHKPRPEPSHSPGGDGSSGGGSSTFTSSSGRTHGGSSGKF